MGLVNSHLKKKKKNLIKKIDILNNAIINLQILNTDTSRQFNKLYINSAIYYWGLDINVISRSNELESLKIVKVTESPGL